MKILKKKFIYTIAICLIFLVSGCQSQNASGKPNGSAAQSENEKKQPVELTFWYPYGDKIGETNENLVKRFNESQNDIKVKAMFQGTYNDILPKLQAASVAKNAPDIFVVEDIAAEPLSKAGILEDLTGFVKENQINLKDFLPAVMENSYIDDKLYTLPYMRSTSILYMNATMLKEAGLDPAGPKTWDELAMYAKKLTIPGKRYGMTSALDGIRFESTVYSNGGKMLTDDGKKALFNSPEGVSSLEFWVKLHQDGVLDFPVGGKDFNDIATQNFFSQRAAIFPTTSSSITKFMESAKQSGFELVAAPWPVRDSSIKTRGTSGGSSVAILANLPEEKKKAAETFLKWLTDTKQVIYESSNTGYQPTRYSAVKSKEMQEIFQQNPIFKVASDQMEFVAPRPMEKAYNEVTSVLRTQFEQAMLDPSISPKMALDEAANQANALLEK